MTLLLKNKKEIKIQYRKKIKLFVKLHLVDFNNMKYHKKII